METSCGAGNNDRGQGIPLGFAQGRLSTAVAFRVRETQPSLRMTECFRTALECRVPQRFRFAERAE
jgi:hypothetical protein